MAGEDPFFRKISALQQSMHATEKRRLVLERELFTYCKSDKRILQIKCSKLRSYHKQICDREARAKMRNLELLREVESLEISMRGYRPDLGPLKELKAQYFTKSSKCVEDKKGMAQIMKKDKSSHRQSDGSSSFSPQAPSSVFLDQQTCRGPNTNSEHSHQAFSCSTNRSAHSGKRLPSGLLKDSGVGGEEAACSRAHLSDDISSSNNSPDGGNLSDKHERTSLDFTAVHASMGVAAVMPFEGDDEGGALSLVTLTRPERNPSPGSSCHSPMRRIKNPLEGKNDSTEVTPQLSPKADVHQQTPEQRTSLSQPSPAVPLSDSSASDLSLTLTQSELEEDFEEDSESNCNSDDRAHPQKTPPVPAPEAFCQSHQANKKVEIPQSVSQEGLFYLLDCIEARLGVAPHLYKDSAVDEKRLNRIIRLCEGRRGMNDEDLEACGAVVLHHLQVLSRSTEMGCLLPLELVRAHQLCTQHEQISSSLPPDAARLWDRWFKHALLLKEHSILNTEGLVQLFAPRLLESNATYIHQAKVLLRTLLSRSSEECPSAEESELSSSRDPPSFQADGEKVQPSSQLPEQKVQDLQSSEEDSQDESPVESVPIRETKAYQLLKQSVMQERPKSSDESEEEDDGASGINRGGEVDLGWARRSSHQDPYPGKERTNSKAYSVLESKAFWGETDDSNSEIEAAVRPQPVNAESDDDFYD
ncbi:centrosomal protein kizuna isoform X1 [Synchiropus splendidus]|uniref:centrosomal protein kizuna isoform X1 n=1 Tax=Synchiropus splendidus TaxID=270530 RepID=UPI00237E3C92|nr:centrosomal protein kizuna isoform X1 [Synchiropus splendidus]